MNPTASGLVALSPVPLVLAACVAGAALFRESYRGKELGFLLLGFVMVSFTLMTMAVMVLFLREGTV